MKKLKKAVVSGFRGIKNEFVIEPECKSLVIIGENSTGKTSIAQSFEWFLNNEHSVVHIKGEGINENDYLHCLVSDMKGVCSVKMEFEDETLEKKLQPSKSRTSIESDSGKFSNLYNTLIVPPCLGYFDVARFVLETKGEKYKILARWMGFEHLMNEQIVLKHAQKEVQLYIKSLIIGFEQKKQELERATGFANIDEPKVVGHCNNILLEVSQKKITKVEELVDRIEVLRQMEISARSEKFISLTTCKTQIGGHVLNDFQIEINNLLKEGIEISKKIDIDPRWRTEALYKAGISVILDKEVSQDSCPMCKTLWPDTRYKSRDELLARIKEELGELKELDEQRSKHRISAETLIEKIQSEIIKMNNFGEFLDRSFMAIGYSDLQIRKASHAYVSALKTYVAIVKLKKWDEIDIKDLDDKKNILSEKLNLFSTALGNEGKKLELSEEDKKVGVAFVKLENIKGKWLDLKERKKQIDFAEKENNKLVEICEKVENVLQDSVQKRFDEVSNLIQTYFEILRPPAHPCNNISDIRLQLLKEGRGGGRLVEVEFTYHKRKSTSPPRRVMTESHLNALGIATYLALVKHLNTETKFLVLDDVINSLDQHHRNNFAKLVGNEFADYQIILFTHDELFFDNLMGEMKDIKKIRLASWSFEGGPDARVGLNRREKIEKSLNDGEPIDAMRDLSVYIESRLNMLCESLGAKTRHNYHGRANHSGSELFGGFEGACKKFKCDEALKKKIKDSKICINLRNHFSHDWQTLASGVSLSEVQIYYNEWISLEEEFRCAKCTSWLKQPIIETYAVCKCGKLRMPKSEE